MHPTVCQPPAQEPLMLCLAAPHEGGQEVGSRNAHQWRAISYFLAGFQTLADIHCSALTTGTEGGQAERSTPLGAGFQTLPFGNHGENLNEAQA